MKKSIFTKIGAAAVALTLVTASLVGGTFAKYTSTANGKATATVAKWAVDLKDTKDAAITTSQTINLVNANTNAVTAENMIAPGSNGTIELVVDGSTAQVGYEYTIEFDLSKINGVPLKFYTINADNSKTPVTVTGNKAVVANQVEVPYSTSTTDMKKTASVYWEWDSASTNDADNALGTAATQVIGEIGITMTAEQLITTTTP